MLHTILPAAWVDVDSSDPVTLFPDDDRIIEYVLGKEKDGDEKDDDSTHTKKVT